MCAELHLGHRRARGFALALVAVAPLLGQAGLDGARRQEIEKLISQEMSRQRIPGLSVAAAVSGNLVWSSGYGMSDVENYVPAKATTVYRLASISKPIAAVAAMQLAEDGKLDLDADIRKYVAAFPKKPCSISARQLLGHLGGIRHYTNQDEIDSTRHYTDLAGPLRIFQNDPLVAEPGVKYHYTSYGYVLLGAAVEAAAGTPFMDLLSRRVFRPAGMDTMSADHVHAIIPNRARGYAVDSSGTLRNCALADTSNKIPGGGLASTPEDLIKFALAVRKGTLVKPATVAAMFTPQKLRDGQPTNYGLGWFITKLDNRNLVSHTGGQQGVSTILAMLPREGAAVALMCNLERAELRQLSYRIVKVLVDGVPASRESASAIAPAKR